MDTCYRHDICMWTLKRVIHKNVGDGSRMIGFPLVIADSEQDRPGIEPGPLGWYTSGLQDWTNSTQV